MKTINPIFLCLFILLWSVSFNTFGQGDPDKPDLRVEGCVNCKGAANNFSMLNVFFSDINGNPADICDASTGPFFLSILYTSNANNDINNFRVIADISKKNKDNNNLLERFYLNEYVGTIPGCKNNTCVITVPIPPITFNCTNEFYELTNPMAVWTPNANKNLKDKYVCNDYPAAQCLNASSFPIEVGVLDFAFEPVFECYQQNINQTNISFIITTLFGGNPTQPYDITWAFELQDGTTITSNEFSPTLINNTSGQVITATLTVKQGTLKRNPENEETTITVPIALTDAEVIENAVVEDSDEGMDNGIIDVEFKPGNYFYYWTSADDPEFYSEEAKIDSLPPGTYTLTTFDEDTGLCRSDVFVIDARILPVEFLDLEVNYLPDSKATSFQWSTAKEWENSHFEIERAVDAIDKFVKIDEVEGMGWKDTVTEYEYTDTKLPLGKAMLYYRLKQVDFDGTATYSKTLSVATPGLYFTQGVWRAHPNPFTSNALQISLLDTEKYDNQELTFRLIQPTSATPDLTVSSIDELNEMLRSRIGSIGKGIVILEIRWGTHIEHLKILKR